MKLSETIASIYENQFDINTLNDLRKSNNAKNVFQIISMGWNSREKFYSNKSCQIMDAIKENSNGFVVDIATKFENISNPYKMSEKQAWCLAFAFIKIQNELINL